MTPEQDKKVMEFMEKVKSLTLETFGNDLDEDIHIASAATLVGIAIGYLSTIIGDDEAKNKVLETIYHLDNEDFDDEPLPPRSMKDLN